MVKNKKRNKYKKPKVACAVAIRKDGKVLLHKRISKTLNGYWGFPGGKLEPGESLEQSVIRETKEEAGIKIHNIKLWTVSNNLFKKECLHYVTILFIADWLDGEPVIMEPKKAVKWEWFEWDKLPDKLLPAIKYAKDIGLHPYKI